MSLFEAIILGAVQGFTEFLPISSTGHLVLAERFLGLSGNFTFDVLLNFGTLLALVIFFRKRIGKVLKQILINRDYKYLGLLLIAVLPTALVGFLLSDIIDDLGKHIYIVVLALAIVGALMIYFGQQREKVRIEDDKYASFTDAIFIGIAQVVALIPGVSRSGSTILMALNRGFSVQAAADFSFMMAIPTILGASFHQLLSSEGRQFISNHFGMFLAGNVTSFVCGAVAIKILLDLLHKRGLRPFGWYRIGLAAVLTVLLVARII